LKLVIFDCDGTLVDSQHMIVAAMTRAYAAHSMPLPDRGVLLSVIGLSLIEAFTKLGEGRHDFPAKSLANHYRDAFHAMRGPGAPVEPLYPGAADAIAQLAHRGFERNATQPWRHPLWHARAELRLARHVLVGRTPR